MTSPEPGPELDAKVAEILGWRKIETNEYSGRLWGIPPGGGPYVRDPSKAVPEFSTSHEAAAQVKEFLWEQWIWFAITYESTGEVAVHDKVIPGPDVKRVPADSEPLALCRFLVKLEEEGVLE